MQISCECFANFVTDFRMTLVRVSHQCRENFHVSRNISLDTRASAVNLSPQNFGEFTMQNFHHTHTNIVRQSRDSLEKTCEHLATIWRENQTKRHLYECRATLSRMSRDCRMNENANKLHSWERRETLSRMSGNCGATITRQVRDIFSKVDQIHQFVA